MLWKGFRWGCVAVRGYLRIGENALDRVCVCIRIDSPRHTGSARRTGSARWMILRGFWLEVVRRDPDRGGCCETSLRGEGVLGTMWYPSSGRGERRA